MSQLVGGPSKRAGRLGISERLIMNAGASDNSGLPKLPTTKSNQTRQLVEPITFTTAPFDGPVVD